MTPKSPERYLARRTEIESKVKAACRAGGMHIVPQAVLEALVGVTTGECIALRERIAQEILGPCIGRYECGGVDGITDRQLEMLAITAEYHYLDEDGHIQLPAEVTRK